MNSQRTQRENFSSTPRKKFPRWLSVVLLFVSLGILIYGFFFFDRDFDYDSLPDGWVIIRPPVDVHAMAIQGDTLWTGGKDGVYLIDRVNQNFLGTLETDPPLEYVKTLLVDEHDVVWIGHANGLTAYDGSNFYHYDETNGLPDNRVNSIIVSHNMELLMGTWKGVVSFNGNEFIVMNKEGGLQDEMVNVMMKGSDGSFWFGSYTAPRGGISIVMEDTVQWFSKENGLPHNNITSIVEERSGRVWVGTGLYKRGGAAWFNRKDGLWEIDSVLTYDDGLAGEKVRSIFQDDDLRLWIGSEYDGVTIFNDDILFILSNEQGLSHPEVKCITQDEDGNIWLGTHDGVTFLAANVVDSLMEAARK